MKKIKAIETVYNGYKFRSRLEARWGVFFNELGVKYKYELEGFDLHYNGYYLPDFFLLGNNYNFYLEIKPERIAGGPLWLCDDKSVEKCIELSMMHNNIVILAFGDPLSHKSIWFASGNIMFPDSAIGFDHHDGGLWLVPTHSHKSQPYLPHDDTVVEYIHKDVATVARQARFEYGETPVGCI